MATHLGMNVYFILIYGSESPFSVVYAMFQMSSQIILTLCVLTQTTGRRELGCSIHSGDTHLLLAEFSSGL